MVPLHKDGSGYAYEVLEYGQVTGLIQWYAILKGNITIPSSIRWQRFSSVCSYWPWRLAGVVPVTGRWVELVDG